MLERALNRRHLNDMKCAYLLQANFRSGSLRAAGQNSMYRHHLQQFVQNRKNGVLTGYHQKLAAAQSEQPEQSTTKYS